MPTLIKQPTVVKAAGNIPKVIREYIGLVNSKTKELSIAHMQSPQGWEEPGQTPEFDEFTVVLKGMLLVDTKEERFEVKGGQAFMARKGEWVKYSTPQKGGAEYMAICFPAFSPATVHRDS